MIPMSQRRAQSTPVPRSEEPSGNVTKLTPFFERNANTIFRCELWGIVVLYTAMYATLGASRFLPGALPFLVGVASASSLPHVVPSSAQRRTVFQSNVDQSFFYKFPAACASTIFGGVGIRLWIWTPAPPQSTPAENMQGQDGLTFWMSFLRYTLLVMTAMLVTAVVLSMVSFWAHVYQPNLKQRQAAAASTSETATKAQEQLRPIQLAELLLHACVSYALRHLILDILPIPIAAFASSGDWARALVDGTSRSGKGDEKGKGEETERDEEI